MFVPHISLYDSLAQGRRGAWRRRPPPAFVGAVADSNPSSTVVTRRCLANGTWTSSTFPTAGGSPSGRYMLSRFSGSSHVSPTQLIGTTDRLIDQTDFASQVAALTLL